SIPHNCLYYGILRVPPDGAEGRSGERGDPKSARAPMLIKSWPGVGVGKPSVKRPRRRKSRVGTIFARFTASPSGPRSGVLRFDVVMYPHENRAQLTTNRQERTTVLVFA